LRGLEREGQSVASGAAVDFSQESAAHPGRVGRQSRGSVRDSDSVSAESVNQGNGVHETPRLIELLEAADSPGARSAGERSPNGFAAGVWRLLGYCLDGQLEAVYIIRMGSSHPFASVAKPKRGNHLIDMPRPIQQTVLLSSPKPACATYANDWALIATSLSHTFRRATTSCSR